LAELLPKSLFFFRERLLGKPLPYCLQSLQFTPARWAALEVFVDVPLLIGREFISQIIRQ
jgi:hypothetical protein